MLFIIFIATAIYANTLNNGFVYDDKGTIVRNEMIKSPGNLSKLFTNEYFAMSKEASYRPLVTLAYLIDYAVFGLKPWGYHLTNILLNTFNGALFYVFAGLLLNKENISCQKSYGSFLITLLYVSHPILTEAVNAISFREDLLAFLFYIATLNLYLSLKTKHFSGFKLSVLLTYLLSCLTFSLALLSKEIALTLPLIIFCYEWIYSDNGNRSLRSIFFNRYNLGYIAVVLAYCYFRFYYFESSLGKSFYVHDVNERLLTIPLLILSYLKLLLIPVSLSAEYVFLGVRSIFSPFFVIPFFAVSLFFVLALKLKKINKETAFGMLFFIITLIPVYNVIPIANSIAERYLYLPSAGFIIAAGSAMQHLSRLILTSTIRVRQRYVLIPLFIILSIFSFVVVNRNMVWIDNYSLWSDAVMKMPKSYRAHYILGVNYDEQGKFNEAIQQFQLASELSPGDINAHIELVIAHFNLGVSYGNQGKFDEAIQQYQLALKLDSTLVQAHYNLGKIYLAKGLRDKAKIEFEKALR